MKEPMTQIAHVVLNSEIEAIVSDAADKALHYKTRRVDDRVTADTAIISAV